MKNIAALFLFAAACGPGLVANPTVVPVSQTPGGGGTTTGPDCSAPAGSVLCGGQCLPLGPLSCGSGDGTCSDCTASSDPGSSCSGGVCVGGKTCAPGIVICASGCCASTQVAAGGNSSCAIVGQGGSTSVYCWGANDTAQLGPAAAGRASLDRAVENAALRGASDIALGVGHGCAIVGGAVLCWGANGAGQLGVASPPQSLNPIVVPGIGGATAIAAGDKHTCAITSGGVVCWGANDLGQLGPVPGSPVPGTQGATQVVAGLDHTCALVSSTILCWGANQYGQLGNQTSTTSPNPDPVTAFNVTTAFDLAAGANHTCAIEQSSKLLKCWGRNDTKQIDGGTELCGAVLCHATPTEVNIGGGVDNVVAGRAHTCARVKLGGDVKCWGDNSFGQLGPGASSASPTSSPVTLQPKVAAGGLSAGATHSCVIDVTTGTNQVYCFGHNDQKQLGPFAQ